MGKKAIYIIIGVLALVLIYMLFKGSKANADESKSSAPGTAGAPPSTSATIDNLMTSLNAATNVGNTADCGKDCRRLCAPLSDKLFGCGDKCQCKKSCEADCVKGLDYKNIYPR